MTRYRSLAVFLAFIPVFSLLSFGQTTRPGAGPTTQLLGTPTTSPVAGTRPGGSPTSRPVLSQNQQRLRRYTRQGIRLLEDRDFDGARDAITKALAIDPNEPTNLYNLACLDALTDRPKEAVAELKRAAENGFDDFAHIAADHDLDSLHDLPEYKALIADKGHYLHVAAEKAVVAMKQEFGPGYIYQVDDADKFIFATNTDLTTLNALKKDLTAQAKSQWATLFSHKPEGYIAVVIPSAADYAKRRPSKNVLGFYNPSNHTLIASGLGFVTTHEFTHALNFGDLETLDQQHPIWLVEGIAVLFEQTHYRGEQMIPDPNMRVWELRHYKATDQLIPFDRLLKMDHSTFMAKAGPGYAESGSIMLYLYQHDLLRPFYEAVKKGYERDHTGKAALEKVTGKSLAEFQKEWVAWMMKLTPPPLYTGPRGAYLGVQFRTGVDGIVIDGVMGKGPGDRAGLKVGDVIVGLNDAEVRDRTAFTPLLATHKPGETVNLSVRRGKDYLVIAVVLGSRPEGVFMPEDPFGGTRPTTRPARTAGRNPTTRP